jgi:hypothetical protein
VTKALETYPPFKDFTNATPIYTSNNKKPEPTFENMQTRIDKFHSYINLKLATEQTAQIARQQQQIHDLVHRPVLTENETATLKGAFPEGSINVGMSRTNSGAGSCVISVNNSALLKTVQEIFGLDPKTQFTKNEQGGYSITVNANQIREKLNKPEFSSNVESTYCKHEDDRMNSMIEKIIQNRTDRKGMMKIIENMNAPAPLDKNALFENAKELTKIFNRPPVAVKAASVDPQVSTEHAVDPRVSADDIRPKR